VWRAIELNLDCQGCDDSAGYEALLSRHSVAEFHDGCMAAELICWQLGRDIVPLGGVEMAARGRAIVSVFLPVRDCVVRRGPEDQLRWTWHAQTRHQLPGLLTNKQ
jgi:hypothetical protein